MRAGYRVRMWTSRLVLMIGFVCLGVWGWSLVRRAIYQDSESEAFDAQVHHAAPALAAGAPIGRLVIKRLHLRAMVEEGTDDHTLDVALGHVKGTAMPGQTGNIGIAGHRDTLFRCLRDIAKGDQIVLQTTRGNYTYHVERIGIVTPKDVDVLAPSPYAAMTLVTCYPFRYVGAAPDRFIVRARLVSAD